MRTGAAPRAVKGFRMLDTPPFTATMEFALVGAWLRGSIATRRFFGSANSRSSRTRGLDRACDVTGPEPASCPWSGANHCARDLGRALQNARSQQRFVNPFTTLHPRTVVVNTRFFDHRFALEWRTAQSPAPGDGRTGGPHRRRAVARPDGERLFCVAGAIPVDSSLTMSLLPARRPPHRPSQWISALALACAPGCGSATVNAELRDLRARFETSERARAELSRKVEELDNRVFLLTDQVESQKVALSRRGGEPRLPVVTLAPPTERVEPPARRALGGGLAPPDEAFDHRYRFQLLAGCRRR